MLIGCGSQYWKLEVTPNGELCFAISLSTPELNVEAEKRSHSEAINSATLFGSTGR